MTYLLEKQPYSTDADVFEEILAGNKYELFDLIPSMTFFICDLGTSEILYVSRSVEEMQGERSDKFINGGLSYFASLIHPDDYSRVLINYVNIILSIQQSNAEFEKLNDLSCEFRIRHINGQWIWVETDVTLLSVTSDKNIAKIFGTIKEITHRRHLNGSMNDPVVRKELLNQRSVLPHVNINRPPDDGISTREKEVLQLIAHGYSAKQIADKLFISIHTAINHRKNLITKFKVKNTAELIHQASKIYWL